MTGGILGVTDGNFTPARKAGSGGKMGSQATSNGGAIMFTMPLLLQLQSAPCFCQVPFTESASAKYKTSTAME
jgi:hypothetical protein